MLNILKKKKKYTANETIGICWSRNIAIRIKVQAKKEKRSTSNYLRGIIERSEEFRVNVLGHFDTRTIQEENKPIIQDG